jgi:predicted phosphodiesterase
MDFKLQYVSDLHLEHYDKNNDGNIIPSMFLIPNAPYLALCGDIGNPDLTAYKDFLAWCSKGYTLVFLVAGNHEFYNYRSEVSSDMPTRIEKIRSLCSKFKNVIFLHRDTYLISEYNIRILGCTLWADTSLGNEQNIITYMNDTRNILLEGTAPLFPRNMTELHRQEKEWLRQEIEQARESKERLVVLTHYLPSFKLIHEKYEGHPLNMCFASDCTDLMIEPVKAWICGHSHTGVIKELNGVKCVMNPYGYPGEKVETRKKNAVLTLGTKEEIVEL